MVQLAAEFGSDLRVKRDVLTSKRDLLTSKRDLLTSKRDLLSAGLHCPCDVAHSDKSSAFLFIVILHGNCTRALSLENPCLHCDAPVTSAAGWEVLGRGDDLCVCVCVCVCLCVCVVCSCVYYVCIVCVDLCECVCVCVCVCALCVRVCIMCVYCVCR